MKKLLKIVVGIALVFALGFGAVLYFTAGMVDTATAFFEAVKKQDMVAARNHLSENFRASTDEGALKQFLTRSAILEFKEASWSSRQISGGQGELKGTVTTETGGVIPIRLTFVKEEGEWKIYNIQKPAAGLQVQADSPKVPGTADQVALIKRSMQDFAVSVERKSMRHFYGTVSKLWQKQITIEKLDEVFSTAYDAGWDMSVFQTLQPVVEPVSGLGEHGELILTGYFPTKPDQFYFEHKYIYEGIDWRLLGFSYWIR